MSTEETPEHTEAAETDLLGRAHEEYRNLNHAYQQLSDEHLKLLNSHASDQRKIAELREAVKQANNLHAVLMGAHGLITMCREHFIERELAACDGNPLYAPECLTALLKINQADKDFTAFKAALQSSQ